MSLSVYGYVHVSEGACRGQKRASDVFELPRGTELRSSPRVTNTLIC